MKVLLFAGLQESLGDQDLEIEVSGKTVSQIKRELVDQFPAAANLIQQSHFAVGHDYVSDSHEFQSEPDEIAIIPPVSGG